MRWEHLFADLESQLDAEQREEERALRIEEERLRLARLGLRDRFVAMMRAEGADSVWTVRIELQGGGAHAVRPVAFGRDWLSGELREPGARVRQCLVPLDRIAAVVPAARQLAGSLEPVPEATAGLADRMGLPFVLRDLCRRRTGVSLTTLDGVVHGTIDRVGRDHLDLAVHEPSAPRREREVRQYRIVPLDRIALVVFD